MSITPRERKTKHDKRLHNHREEEGLLQNVHPRLLRICDVWHRSSLTIDAVSSSILEGAAWRLRTYALWIWHDTTIHKAQLMGDWPLTQATFQIYVRRCQPRSDIPLLDTGGVAKTALLHIQLLSLEFINPGLIIGRFYVGVEAEALKSGENHLNSLPGGFKHVSFPMLFYFVRDEISLPTCFRWVERNQ